MMRANFGNRDKWTAACWGGLLLWIGCGLLAGCSKEAAHSRGGPEWRDPYQNESIPSGRDDSRLVLLIERGIEIDENRRGGGIRLHRYTGSGSRRQSVWIALISEFSGLNFAREARLAVVQSDVLVEIAYKNQLYAVDYESGTDVRPIDASDPLVQAATSEGAWHEVTMFQPEQPASGEQSGQTL